MKFSIVLATIMLFSIQGLTQVELGLIELDFRTNADPMVLPQGNEGAWLAHFLNHTSRSKGITGRVALIDAQGELVKYLEVNSKNHPDLEGHLGLWYMPNGKDLSVITTDVDAKSLKLNYHLWTLTPDGQLSNPTTFWSTPLGVDADAYYSSACFPSVDHSKLLIVSPTTTDYVVIDSKANVLSEGHLNAGSDMGIMKGSVSNEGLPAFMLGTRKGGVFSNKAALAFGYQSSQDSELSVVDVTPPPGYFNFNWTYLENKPNGNPVLIIFATNANAMLKGFSYTEFDLQNNQVVRQTIEDKKALPYDMNDSQLYFSEEGEMVICSDARAAIELVRLDSDFNLSCCQLITDPFKEKEMHYAYYIVTEKGPIGLALCDEKGMADVKAENGKRHGLSKKAPLKLAIVEKGDCSPGKVKTGDKTLTGFSFPTEDLTKRKRLYFVNGMYFVPLEKDEKPYYVVWRE